MVGDIWVTYFSKFKMACTEFSSDNNFYIKRWNLIVLFHFENRHVFLPHPVVQKKKKKKKEEEEKKKKNAGYSDTTFRTLVQNKLIM